MTNVCYSSFHTNEVPSSIDKIISDNESEKGLQSLTSSQCISARGRNENRSILLQINNSPNSQAERGLIRPTCSGMNATIRENEEQCSAKAVQRLLT